MAAARCAVAPSTTAPAASVGPSIPSVPAERRKTPSSPSNSRAAPSANSWLGPPRPSPFTLTVVSPPARRQTGSPPESSSTVVRRACRPSSRPTSLASPVKGVEWRRTRYPRARASSRAPSSAVRLFPTRCHSVFVMSGSEGFGVSGTRPAIPASRCRRTGSGSSGQMPLEVRTRTASAKVVGSGETGPEAITSARSPTTSERTSATTRPGAAAWASRPPFTRSRCFRTAFSSSICAPERRRRSVVITRSLREMPGGGRAMRADPPPESSSRRVSSGSRPTVRSSTARAAARLPEVGVGWPPWTR